MRLQFKQSTFLCVVICQILILLSHAEQSVGQQVPVEKLAQSWNSTGSVDWNSAAILGLLSKSAYEDDTELMNFVAIGMGFDSCETFQAENSFAYALIGEKVVVIAFRGTEFKSLSDWKTDANAKFLRVPGVGRVHSGFHIAYGHVKNEVETTIANNRGKQIWLTGHSLGGAMAVVCGVNLKQKNLADPRIITFGQPRVGDNSTAQWIDRSFPKSYQRIVNDQDVVPTLPPTRFFQYADAGRYVLIGRPQTVGSPVTESEPGQLANKIITTKIPSLLKTPAIAFPVVGGTPTATEQDDESEQDRPEEVYQSPAARLPLTSDELDNLIQQENQFRAQQAPALSSPVALTGGASGQPQPVAGLASWFNRELITDHYMAGYLELIRGRRDR